MKFASHFNFAAWNLINKFLITSRRSLTIAVFLLQCIKVNLLHPRDILYKKKKQTDENNKKDRNINSTIDYQFYKVIY